MARRGRGEGSIYPRTVKGERRFVGTLSFGVVNGKRVRKSVTGTSKAEVRAKLKQLQRSADDGLSVAQASQTVGAWLTKWLSQLETGQKRRPSTIRRYSSLARVHLIPALGHHRLDRLGRVQIDDFLSAKLGELEPRTVHHLRAVLRTALNRALKDGLVVRNAAALTDPVEVPARPRRFLTVEEALALLRAAQGHRLEALYILDLNVGLRIGEALGLRWQDVDLEAGRLNVVFNLQRVKGRLTLVEPKTEKSRRTIGLPAAVSEALKAHRRHQNEERLRLGPAWTDSQLIFTSQIGSPLDPSDVSRDFRAFLAAKELPRVRFHDLRHAAGSIMLKNGTPMHIVSRILGHSNIATTVDIYGHVEDQSLDDAAVAMGRALG